jgi:hypothetical protein
MSWFRGSEIRRNSCISSSLLCMSMKCRKKETREEWKSEVKAIVLEWEQERNTASQSFTKFEDSYAFHIIKLCSSSTRFQSDFMSSCTK